jgi:hypothetical protein
MTKSPMTTSSNLFAALLLTVLLGTQTQAQSERPLKFLSKQCNEDAIELHLDPSPFQHFVGPEFSLVLEEGKARVLIIVHDCSQYWIDGEDLGRTQEIRVWVLIHGVEDVRDVVGAERTLPTRTWFTLFDGSTNPRVRAARTASGTAQAPIDGVFLDPPGPQRGGRVSLGRNVNYSWAVTSPATPLARLVGLNHDVYARDPAGKVILNRVQALMHVSAGPSRGTLEVVGGTDAVPLISPGTYQVSVSTFFPMWSRATLGLSPSR